MLKIRKIGGEKFLRGLKIDIPHVGYEEEVLISENIYAILSIGKKRDNVSSEQKEPPGAATPGGSS